MMQTNSRHILLSVRVFFFRTFLSAVGLCVVIVCNSMTYCVCWFGMLVLLIYVTAELGDWSQIEDHDYVSNMRMLPKQSVKFTDKVADLHKALE